MPRTQITYDRVPGTIVNIDGDGWANNLNANVSTLTTSTLSTWVEPANATAPQPTLHVCWQKDAHGNGWAQFMFRCDPEYLRQLLADQKPGDDAQIELYTEILSRSECNTAIRAARTARDQAYGRDE